MFTRARALAELVRPANVTTALADVLAGYAISGGGSRAALLWLLAATAGLYGGGVVLNDVFDRHLDAVERPERPIPSGRFPARGAAWVGAGLLLLGVAAATRAASAAAVIAMAIAGLVVAYDAWGKAHGVVGPVTMGTCRGLNLLLGVAAAPAALATRWPIALMPFAYIMAVTALSRGEVHGGRRGTGAFSFGVVAGVLAALALLAGWTRSAWPALVVTALLAWRVLPPFWRARHGNPAAIRRAVRAGVLSLVLVDAALAAGQGGLREAAAILLLGVVAVGLSRLFAVT